MKFRLLVFFLLIHILAAQSPKSESQTIKRLQLIDLQDILKQLNVTVSQLIQQQKSLSSNSSTISLPDNNKFTPNLVQQPKNTFQNAKKVETQTSKSIDSDLKIKKQQIAIDKISQQLKVYGNLSSLSNNQAPTIRKVEKDLRQISTQISNQTQNPPRKAQNKTTTTQNYSRINKEATTTKQSSISSDEKNISNVNKIQQFPVQPVKNKQKDSKFLNQSRINTSVPLEKKTQKTQQFQKMQKSFEALYQNLPSYRNLKTYFIISKFDKYLSFIEAYLMVNYGHYLKDGKLTAGFRRYLQDGDKIIEYQLLYETKYGTFTTIILYYTTSQEIKLKTLSILNLSIMDIDYENCHIINQKQQNCEICMQGFRNFMGRCRQINPFCVKYITDECVQCMPDKNLMYGQCS